MAVKKLHNQLTEKELEDFRKEGKLMASLRPHPNGKALSFLLSSLVVQFLGICSSPKKPLCLVSTFMDGGSLYHLLRKPEAFSEESQIKIATGIAAGMQHLSSEGIVHRDLAAR